MINMSDWYARLRSDYINIVAGEVIVSFDVDVRPHQFIQYKCIAYLVVDKLIKCGTTEFTKTTGMNVVSNHRVIKNTSTVENELVKHLCKTIPSRDFIEFINKNINNED